MTEYTAQDFNHLIGTPGFSDRLMTDHFKLYEGYVENTNKSLETTARLAKEGKSASPEFAEVRRRFGWEWNGMRLHELYFGGMTKTSRPLAKTGEVARSLGEAYGSFDAWAADFKATGAMRGIGWAALYYDPVAGRALNGWINEHHEGELAGCPILLVMDVFEHAFLRDYGVKKDGYIEAFFGAIDWSVVETRFDEALRAAPALAASAKS